jgi:hypothetical protein
MSATADGFGERTVPVRPLDEEQARLLEILMAADGGPVSFDELRERGIENPATLAYELEIAGLPIAQLHEPHAGGLCLQLGVQLAATQTLPVAGGERSDQLRIGGERPGSRRRAGRWTLATVAAGLALALLGILLSGALSGSATKHGGARVVGSLASRGTPALPATSSDGADSNHSRAHPAPAKASPGTGSASSSASTSEPANASELQAVPRRRSPKHRNAPNHASSPSQARTVGRTHRAPSAQPGGTSAPAPDASRGGTPSRKASPERKTGAAGGHGRSGRQPNSSPPSRTNRGGHRAPSTGPSGQRQAPSPTPAQGGQSQAPSGGQPAPTGGQEAPSARTSDQSG